jgi:hypothetical protein
VLDEVLLARAVGQNGVLEFPGRVQLVVAGEQVRLELPLVVLLTHEVAAEDFEPTVPLPDFFPEIGRPVAAFGVYGVACGAVVTLVERQELSGWPREPRDHEDVAVAHGEVDEGAAGPVQERLGGFALRLRVAVEAVLVDGILDALREVGLEFNRGDRDTVQEQDEIDAVLVLERVPDLP